MQRLTVHRLTAWILLLSFFSTAVFATEPPKNSLPSHEACQLVLSPDVGKIALIRNELKHALEQASPFFAMYLFVYSKKIEKQILNEVLKKKISSREGIIELTQVRLKDHLKISMKRRHQLVGYLVILSILTPMIAASIWCGNHAPALGILLSLISIDVAGAPILEPTRAMVRRFSYSKRADLPPEAVKQWAQSPVWEHARKIYMRFQTGDTIAQQGMFRYNEALLLISQILTPALPPVKATACSIDHVPDPEWVPPKADLLWASEQMASLAMLMHQNFIDIEPNFSGILDQIHTQFTEWISPKVRVLMLPLVMERLKKRDTRLNGSEEDLSETEKAQISKEYEKMVSVWLAPGDASVWVE